MSDFFYLARRGGHFVIEIKGHNGRKEHGPFPTWSAAQGFVMLKGREAAALAARSRKRGRQIRWQRKRRELDQGEGGDNGTP